MATKSSENILTPRQISSLYRQVSLAFAEDLNNKLTIDLSQFRKQVDKVVKAMALTETFHSSTGKHKGWQLANYDAKHRALAARGYILIFKFRQFLLNEDINYRYYFTDVDGLTKAAAFTEDDIARYMKFTTHGIEFNESALKADVNKIDKIYSDFMEHYFTKYTKPDVNDYMQVALSPNGSKSYGRIVRKRIMQKYEKMNPGLRTKDNRYQMFNKGHIYEAIDTSTSRMLLNNEKETVIDKYVFGYYLRLDNIKASRGGDNPFTRTSIKSSGADLYDYSTIKDQLILIQTLVNGGTKNKSEMAQIISDMFLSKEKYATEDAWQQAADKAVNKLLKEFKRNLTLN